MASPARPRSSAGAIPMAPAGMSCYDEQEAAQEGFEFAVVQFARAFARLMATEMRLQIAAALNGIQPTAPAHEGTVDVAKAMRLLGVSRDSLYKLIKSQALPSLKIGGRRLFRPVDIEAFLKKQAESSRW